MIGSPIVATLVLSLLFIAVGITGFSALRIDPTPASRPTHSSSEVQNSERFAVSLIIRSAHPLDSLACYHAGKLLDLDKYDATEFEAEVSSPSEFQLKVVATWPEGTPETALLVNIIPTAEHEISQTFWGQGELTEELTIKLK